MQRKLLNVITFRQRETDKINLMITITSYFYTVIYCIVTYGI